MSGPLSEHRLYRRRQGQDLAAFVPMLDGHPVRLTLLRGRKQVALATGVLTVDVADRDIVVRLSVAGTTFLIAAASFRMAVYSPPPAARLVITMFDHVPLTLVAVLDADEEGPGGEHG